MKNFSIEEINDRFNSLSPELQTILTSSEVKENLESIAQKNGLKLDELGVMVDLVGLIILGLISPNEFVEQFSSETGITEKSARILVGDLNTELFSKIRTTMREFKEKNRPSSGFTNNQPYINQNAYDANAFTKPTPPPIPVVESPHADLEQAGNFKIETEGNLENNYSLKSLGARPRFVTEQARPEPAPASIPTPLAPTPEPVPEPVMNAPIEAPTSTIDTASKMQAFDPKNFYNFGNIEEKIEEVKEVKKDEPKKEEAKVAPVTDNQIFQKSASTIHYEKNLANKHTKISASQSYQPKIKDIETIELKQPAPEAPEVENLMVKANTALIDEMIAHPKPVVTIVPEEPKKTEVVPANLPVEVPAELPKEIVPIKPIEKPTPLVVEAPVVALPPQLPTETPAVVVPPLLKVETPVVVVPPKLTVEAPVSDEEIRNDIRSKIAEYNPTTTWPKETAIVSPVVEPEITNTNDSGVINLIPIKTPTPPPVERKPEPVQVVPTPTEPAPAVSVEPKIVETAPSDVPTPPPVVPKSEAKIETSPQPINKPRAFDPYRESIS